MGWILKSLKGYWLAPGEWFFKIKKKQADHIW